MLRVDSVNSQKGYIRKCLLYAQHLRDKGVQGTGIFANLISVHTYLNYMFFIYEGVG